MGEAKRRAKAGYVVDKRRLTPTLGFPVNLKTWVPKPMNISGKTPEDLDRLLPLIRYAISLQGMAAAQAPKSHAALHEAGHAMILAFSGIPIKNVRIEEEYSAQLGLRVWGGFTSWGDVKGGLADVRMVTMDTVAGLVAERIHARDYAMASSVDEVIRYFDMCAIMKDGEWNTEDHSKLGIMAVRSILEYPPCMKEHLALADTLKEKEFMYGDEVERMLHSTIELGVSVRGTRGPSLPMITANSKLLPLD